MKDDFKQMVREGKIPGVSIDPDNPATAYDSMDIYSKPGTKVRFTGYGGYEYQQEFARRFLDIDGIYTVEDTDVQAWHTDVFLRERPKKGFNSVMFAEVE